MSPWKEEKACGWCGGEESEGEGSSGEKGHGQEQGQDEKHPLRCESAAVVGKAGDEGSIEHDRELAGCQQTTGEKTREDGRGQRGRAG
jgi:hypothetical protein